MQTAVVSIVVAMASLVILSTICLAQEESTCQQPYKKELYDKLLKKCYFPAGDSDTFIAAPLVCAGFGGLVLSISSPEDFGDLQKLYKHGPYYFLWLGATANTTFPKDFYWQNGEPVNADLWCSGHPKGDANHLCSYYSGMPMFGNKHCMYSGKCRASFFRHGIVCEEVQ